MRSSYLKNDSTKYKDVVWTQLSGYFDSLRRKGSIYLSDRDNIEFSNTLDTSRRNTLYDEPYRSLADNVYQYTMDVFGEFTIKNHSDDGSWEFGRDKNIIFLQYKNPAEKNEYLKVSSTYDNPFYNFFHVFFWGGVLFIVSIAVYLLIQIALTERIMSRLFMLKFFRRATPDKAFKKFFAVRPGILFVARITIPAEIKMDFFKGGGF
jgi:hypothetical protein